MLQRKSFFYLFSGFLLIALFVGADRLAHPKGQRFALSKIVTSYRAPEWQITPSPEEDKRIATLLDQKFSYLCKGSQSYVLISEDGKYILKFLKQQQLHPKTWLAYLPLPFNPYAPQRSFFREKQRKTFTACKIAFTELALETGLLYVHLNQTSHLNKKITVFDKGGKPLKIPLDKTSFLVQKKADLIYPRIAELMEQKNSEGAKKVISSVFDLLEHLGKKGIVDNDPILKKNFGLIEDRAVQIDIGRMRINPERIGTSAYKREIPSIAASFKQWITRNYPELLDHFEDALHRSQ
jgi:hypothetical protein